MNMYRYFQAHHDYFWQWEDRSEVIAIPQGNTIAYKQMLIDILEHLSPQGIPNFGTLLLAIVATNPNAKSDLKVIESLTRSKFLERFQGRDYFIQNTFFDAMEFLNMLSEVPSHFKIGKPRLILLQAIFGKGHNMLSYKKNHAVIHTLKKNRYEAELLIEKKIIPSAHIYHNDFRQFALLKQQLPDLESIINRLTDLPEMDGLIEPEELEEPSLVYDDFVEVLVNHKQSFHVGALIKQLWSGLDIPVHHTMPNQQPLGGVSDITNKGEYSRLLASEFANDDIVFLSRLANNEALFLNREAPPQTSNMERVILLDASIKSWGTPKTIAHAIMLAIARHPKTDIQCQAFAIGNAIAPLKFNTVEEVVAGLQVLDPSLHPAIGLEQFIKSKYQASRQELIFIGSKDTFQHPAFRKSLNDNQQEINFLIQIEHQGQIDVFRRLRNSKKHLQSIQLPLASLWQKKPKSRKTEPVLEGGQASYPILFPSASYPKVLLKTNDDEVFQITKKHLLRLYDKKQGKQYKGWEMIYENLPYKGEGQIGLMENDDYVLLLFNRQNREIVWLNLTTGDQQSMIFKEWKFSNTPFFFFHNNAFNYLSFGEHWVIKADPKLTCIELKSESSIRDEYRLQEQSMKKLRQTLWFDYSVLKNIKRVFINQRGNLVFNAHELVCTMSGVRLVIGHDHVETISASVTTRDEFTFPNGNKITVNRLGMLTLNTNQSAKKYLLMLKKAGTQKMKLIRNLKMKTSIPLTAINRLVHHTPSIIASDIDQAKAELLKETLLEGLDAEIEVVPYQSNSVYIPTVLERYLGLATDQYFTGNEYFFPSRESKLKKIGVSGFWDKYIKSFINQAGYGT